MYNNEETELIKEAFKVTRMKFDEEPSIKKERDVIFALREYHDKMHMSPSKTPLAHKIFAKHGFWRDGKTTIEDRKRQLYERKVELEKRVSKIAQKKKSRIEEYQAILEEKKKEIIDLPERLKGNLQEQANAILANVRTEINEYEQVKKNEISRILREYDDQVKEQSKTLLEGAFEQLERLKNAKLLYIEREIEDSVKDMNKTFANMMLETDALGIEAKTRDQIDEIESELDELEELEALVNELDVEPEEELEEEDIEEDYEQLTIAQLKEKLDQKGIPYNQRELKSNLINLLKE